MKIVVGIVDMFVNIEGADSCVDSLFFEKMSSYVAPATAPLA